MKSESITNILILLVAVFWFVKIHFHYVYLKSIKAIDAPGNFISFYLRFENFFWSGYIISPFFADKLKPGSESGNIRARVATLLLWLSMIVAIYWMYRHPVSNEPREEYYDFR
jgi:hypothetical protein